MLKAKRTSITQGVTLYDGEESYWDNPGKYHNPSGWASEQTSNSCFNSRYVKSYSYSNNRRRR